MYVYTPFVGVSIAEVGVTALRRAAPRWRTALRMPLTKCYLVGVFPSQVSVWGAPQVYPRGIGDLGGYG